MVHLPSPPSILKVDSHSLTASSSHADPGAPNESTLLLSGGDEESVSRRTKHSMAGPTPLPKAQLYALIAIRMVDPIAYLQVFPYINQLLADMRVAKPDCVGFYSGLIESIYSLAQLFAVYQCGKASDAIGRRLVVFIGLLGTALTTTTFGLSTSFAGIVASRFFGGLFAGNLAVIHSILAEITDDSNQDLAVPIFGLAWPMGAMIGPLIGGTLANAAMRHPKYFSWSIFVQHPYLPPCLVGSGYALIGASLGYILIKETLPSKRQDAHTSAHSSFPPESDADTDSNKAKTASVMELLSMPAIRILTVSGFALNFLSFAFDVVYTLLCYTPVDVGGLGLEPSTIGNIFASAGIVSILLHLFVTPYIFRRFDYAKTYNACMYIWPVAFGLLPCLNLLVRTYPPSNPKYVFTSALIWTGLFTLIALSRVGLLPFSVSMILIKQHSPSASLGRSNGLVQFAMCLGRTLAPVLVSTLFTGVNGIGWVKRWGVGWIWAVVMVVGGVAAARLTERISSGTAG